MLFSTLISICYNWNKKNEQNCGCGFSQYGICLVVRRAYAYVLFSFPFSLFTLFTGCFCQIFWVSRPTLMSRRGWEYALISSNYSNRSYIGDGSPYLAEVHIPFAAFHLMPWSNAQ